MQMLRLLLPLLALAAGIAIGALNPQPVRLDLGIVVLHSTLGLVLLATLLLGVLAGGVLLLVSTVLPLQRRLRAVDREVQAPPVEGR
jgi:uncharacterized membrane protein YedE/YeeE